jgi:tyrosyl-tRNA synthetase
MNLIADLRERGLLHDIMPGTEEQLNKEMTSGYIGFDPTADSLHIGSMLQITLLMRLQRAGHKPYALIGGATGMIGDPTGKSAERNLLDAATIEKNCAGIRRQLEKFIDFNSDAPNAAVMVNNYDWFKNFSFLDFVRDVGKSITVNYMLAKDSVQKRLEHGMSFTEFTYQLIQGYDFYHLNKNHNVKLQMGGSDQWGNIVTGTELVRKKGGSDAFALVSPLITKSDGSKFGKSEGGNIWLDPERTSPYQFYQFWLNLPDADTEKMLLIYSFRPVEELKAVIEEHRKDPGLRVAQKALADEITTLVHSAEDLESAKNTSQILFGKATVEALRTLSDRQILDGMAGLNQVTLSKETLSNGLDIISFLADNGILPSRGEAKKLLQGNGIAINKEKVTADFAIKEEHLLNSKYLLVLKGKKDYTLAIFE